MGASAVVIGADEVRRIRKRCLGSQAEVYDAELWGLADGALSAIPEAMRATETAHTIVFCADNSAAIETITRTDGHPGQHLSVRFCNAVNEYLEADPRKRVVIRWTPGHKGIRGNELADRAAKEAATHDDGSERPQPTYTHLRRRAREAALQRWRRQWRLAKHERTGTHRGNLYSVADRFEPNLKPQPHFRNILSRHVYGLTLQCRTGHAFMGEYYQRFVPTEPIGCPCGASLQTRKHILLDCPRYDSHRHLLRHQGRPMTVNDIVGTDQGIVALAKFIAATGAFTKTGDASVRVDTAEESEGRPARQRDRRRAGGRRRGRR